MSRRLRPSVALALVALIAAIGAGCGSSRPSETGAADSAGTKTADAQAKAVRFAACMRASGVPDFPDANARGEFVYGVSVTPAVWETAVEACKELQPPGALSAQRRPEEQAAALAFAACIREHGVKDFPDPVNGEPLINTYKIPSSNRPGGMDILNAAIEQCGRIMDEAASGR